MAQRVRSYYKKYFVISVALWDFSVYLSEYVYKNKFFCCQATVRFAPPNK